MIDINKSYTTRDGRPVRILATDLKNTEFPVAVAMTTVTGREVVNERTIDGKFYDDGSQSDSDLIEVKPRIKRTVWLNVYPHSVQYVYATKKSADEYGSRDRIACVKVEIDCEEGEGP